MSRSAAQIRQDFLDYFHDRHAHTVVPSSPVVPHDDPTLLFANAGMNQFKDVFLGLGTRDYSRAVDTQKCIRAGGKHNDLEDVGADGYHHTFFEMLGNWSFGDYFKAEAIAWAWELLTSVWGIDTSRLYVTVFAGDASEGLAPDEEAEAIWRGIVPADRVGRFGKKDNFWEMGETGPCGPCSEIHYDGRSDAERAERPGAELVNQDHPDVIELWNLVFIQFNRGEDGNLTPLPARHVDTGMGLERVVRVLQHKRSNYDTDLWDPIFAAIGRATGAPPYRGSDDDPVDIAYRVIADHVRCLSVAIADGAPPSNEGRGYVLRRILRRAARHARQTMGVARPVLCDVVPAVVESLGGPFPPLREKQDEVVAVVRDEEETFLRTLDRGLALFDEAAGGGAVISAEDAFRLHDTYGFPVDLTRVMAEERGLEIDVAGYERLMEEARDRSRGAATGADRMVLSPEAIATLRERGVAPSDTAAKQDAAPLQTRIEAIWNGHDLVDAADVRPGGGDPIGPIGVVLAATNHYAEAGGQVGDRGRIQTAGGGVFDVEDTRQIGVDVLHVGRVASGGIRVGDAAQVAVDRARRAPTMANHTATHMLNHALRAVLGGDVEQRGSLVAPDRLRFDFTSGKPMTSEQVAEVEALVTRAIDAALPVYAEVAPLAEAQRIHGVRAVFGERYPDPVRVVSIGAPVRELLARPDNADWSRHAIEFCGGTHLQRTDEAGGFVLLTEQALAAGVRRVLAVTGSDARRVRETERSVEAELEATARLDGAALVEAVDAVAARLERETLGLVFRHRVEPWMDGLRDRVKKLRKAAHGEARDHVVAQARDIAARAKGSVIVESMDGADKETLLSAMDVIRAKCPETATMLLSPDDDAGKVMIAAAVPPELIQRGLKAGDWVREAAKVCGGGGGGRPDMAQAGGKDPSKVPDAVEAAISFAEAKLS